MEPFKNVKCVNMNSVFKFNPTKFNSVNQHASNSEITITNVKKRKSPDGNKIKTIDRFDKDQVSKFLFLQTNK